MGILSKLFGSEKVIDAGISGIDKAFYTKEEQAEDELKKINYKMAFMKLYEPFKIAQRFVALMVGIPFVVIHFVITVIWLITIFMVLFFAPGESYDFVVGELGRVADMNNRALGEPFGYIVIFYFLGGAGESFAKGILSRFKK